MGREEIGRARVDVRLARIRLQLRVAAQRGEEPHRAIGIVAGARGDADADPVGLEFLRAREARERDLGFGERERPGLRIAQHVLHDAAHQRHLARLVLSYGGMACDHVRHFVGEHRGELGRVVGQRDQPARHVELPARQREGVDRRRIENGDAIVHVRPLGCGDELGHRLVEHGFELGILVGAAIGGEDALMLALRRSRHLLLLLEPAWAARERGQRPRRRADREQGRAAAREREPEQRRHAQTCRPDSATRGIRRRSARMSGRAVAAASVCPCGFHDGDLRVPSVPFGDLDLLRAGGLDPRPVALFDPSADPNAAVFKSFRLDAGGGEHPLVALREWSP